MKKLHLAIGVACIEEAVRDYTKRFGQVPDIVVPSHYALWRTEQLNVSIRQTGPSEAGKVRHLGWETPDASEFTTEVDASGIIWERFTAEQQAQEIRDIWPSTSYHPRN